ncbi:MAG: MarR family transcriptional regulator [Deltaproteobacteria bacterium]|jgi:DNA-binding MarR family transcriptional regulator
MESTHIDNTADHATKNIGWLLRRLMQAEEQYTKALEKTHHVTSAQLSCLLALYENGPLPPSQIGRIIMVNSSTVTGIIDRLERKGLVERARTSQDRRIITISLTGEGSMLVKNAPLPVQNKIVAGIRRLSTEEVEQIVCGLTRLTSMLDDQGGGAGNGSSAEAELKT